MSLPDGVTTCLLTYGPITDTFGNLADSITVEVVADRTIVHAASGRTLFKNPVSVTADGGGVAQLPVPHTDQAGFRDQQQNTLTGWYYTVRLTARFGNGIQTDTKTFQPLVGQTTVDADLLPSNGMVTPGVTAPTATVTSVNGQTGAVDLSATFVPRPSGGTDGQALIKDGDDIVWGDVASGGGGEPYVPFEYTDNFNRADAATLGADWTQLTGQFNIGTNLAYAPDGNSTTAHARLAVTGTPTGDYRFGAKVGAQNLDDPSACLTLRIQDATNFMLLQASKDLGLALYSARGGSFTLRGTRFSSAPVAVGDVIEMSVVGNVYTCFRNGTQQGDPVTFSDASSLSGPPGIRVGSSTFGWDDFHVLDLTPAPPSSGGGSSTSSRIGSGTDAAAYAATLPSGTPYLYILRDSGGNFLDLLNGVA